MIGLLVNLLIVVIICAVLWVVANKIMAALGVDAKIVVLVQCLLLLIFLVMFLGGVGLVGGTDWPRYNYRL
jgi:hypothetical protein